VPVIADANSMTYVLHRSLGETLVITRGGREITLRFVAALSDSIFQRELLMSQGNFLKLFPDEEGFPFLLVDTDQAPVGTVRSKIEDGLRDFGADFTVLRTPIFLRSRPSAVSVSCSAPSAWPPC
jgi:hypothetical protein